MNNADPSLLAELNLLSNALEKAKVELEISQKKTEATTLAFMSLIEEALEMRRRLHYSEKDNRKWLLEYQDRISITN
jgi:hypothetical protein